MTRLARALLALTSAVPVLALTATPALAAPAPVPSQVEAESVRSPGATAVPDATASGRRATSLAPGRSLTVRVTAPATGSRLVLRLRTAAPGSAPVVTVVTVDGRRAAGPVAGRTWQDHAVAVGAPAGVRTVTVTNPAGRRGALLVDRVALVAARPNALTPVKALDDAYEARVVQLVNVHRAAAGLPRLAVSACADRYAEDWSATMARTGAFQHRKDLGAVMKACRGSAVGENIAYGSVSADQLMAMWMASPGHRANILSPRFTHIGVAAVTNGAGRTYGTQQFLRL